MDALHEILEGYKIKKFDAAFGIFREVSQDEAEYVLNNGYLEPVNLSVYEPKNILVAVIVENKIQFYKAMRN